MLNTTHGREERYAPPCCNETRPADQRGDYAGKLTELFFARPYNLETLPVNYSACFGCGERVSNEELVKVDGDWVCEKCEMEIQHVDCEDHPCEDCASAAIEKAMDAADQEEYEAGHELFDRTTGARL